MNILILAGLLSFIATTAIAQQSVPVAPGQSAQHAETTGVAAKDAPVGHRQPKQGDLPGAVQRDEHTGSEPDPLGPLPQICRNC